MRIRRVSVKDTSRVASLRQLVRKTDYPGFFPNEPDMDISQLEAEKNDANSLEVAFVAELETTVIGFTKAQTVEARTYRCLVRELFVHPSQRRQYVGTALLATLARTLEEQDLNTLVLEQPHRSPAQAFCQALGGKWIGMRERSLSQLWRSFDCYGWLDFELLKERKQESSIETASA